LEQHIVSLLNSENVCYFWNHIQTLEAPFFQEACKKYFCSNLHLIFNTSGFLALDRTILLAVFYPKQNSDASGLSNQFSPQSMPFRTQALTRWFAAHQPERLKRKLTEQCLPPSIKRFSQICSQQTIQ